MKLGKPEEKRIWIIPILEEFDEYCIYKAPECTHLYSCQICNGKKVYQAYGETLEEAVNKTIEKIKERDGEGD